MALVFHCPTCQQPGTYSARDLGRTVSCPNCKNLLTLPATPHAAPPPNLAFENGPVVRTTAPARPPRLARVMVVGLVALVTTAAGVAALYYARTRVPAPADASGQEKAARPDTPPRKDNPAGPVKAPAERPRKAEEARKLDPTPPKPAPTFPEVWDEAVRVSDDWNAVEPAATAKALTDLGRIDASKARLLMNACMATNLVTIYPELTKYELDAFAASVSRREAMQKAGPYRAVANQLWTATVPAEDIAKAASFWYSAPPEDRILAVAAIGARRRPLTTSATKFLNALPGGAAWLKGLGKE